MRRCCDLTFMCRADDSARLAAMAARVAAMEQALAAREAQMAQDGAAPRRNGSFNECTRAADVYAEPALGWREAARSVQQKPEAALPPQRSSVGSYPPAAISAPTSPADSWSAADECGLADPHRPALPSPADDSRHNSAVEHRPSAEVQCCAQHCSAAHLASVAARDGFRRSEASASGSRHESLPRRLTAQELRPTQSQGWSDRTGGLRETADYCAMRRTTAAASAQPAPPQPAGHADDESQPRAQLPAPMRPRAASAKSSPHEDLDCEAAARRRSAPLEGGDAVLCSHRAHSGIMQVLQRPPRGVLGSSASDPRQSSDHGQPMPASAGRTSRQPAFLESLPDLPDEIMHVEGDRTPPASPPASQLSVAAGLADIIAGNPSALVEENAALRAALHSCNASLAAAQDAARRSDARIRAMTSQLETVGAAARDDAKRVGAGARALKQELQVARAAAQTEAAAAAASASTAAESAAAAEELARQVESLEAELADAQGQLASARLALPVFKIANSNIP